MKFHRSQCHQLNLVSTDDIVTCGISFNISQMFSLMDCISLCTSWSECLEFSSNSQSLLLKVFTNPCITDVSFTSDSLSLWISFSCSTSLLISLCRSWRSSTSFSKVFFTVLFSSIRTESFCATNVMTLSFSLLNLVSNCSEILLKTICSICSMERQPHPLFFSVCSTGLLLGPSRRGAF